MINIDFTTKSEVIPEYTKKGDCLYLYDENGKLHSYNDLPAVITSLNSKHWYNHGLLHRNNGKPAITTYFGLEICYENGIQIK